MPFPELAVIAEGELPTGERWTVRAGRTPEDYELQPVATDSLSASMSSPPSSRRARAWSR
jgi:hypothetical protein